MLSTKEINQIIIRDAMGGRKTPHSTSRPVLYQENGKYYFAAFIFTYTREDIENGVADRPTMWLLADMQTGEIVSRRDAQKNDFSNASYDKKYNIKADAQYDTSQEYYDKTFELLDTVREALIVEGQLNLPVYAEYLRRIVANIPKEYQRFYYDLSIPINYPEIEIKIRDRSAQLQTEYVNELERRLILANSGDTYLTYVYNVNKLRYLVAAASPNAMDLFLSKSSKGSVDARATVNYHAKTESEIFNIIKNDDGLMGILLVDNNGKLELKNLKEKSIIQSATKKETQPQKSVALEKKDAPTDKVNSLDEFIEAQEWPKEPKQEPKSTPTPAPIQEPLRPQKSKVVYQGESSSELTNRLLKLVGVDWMNRNVSDKENCIGTIFVGQDKFDQWIAKRRGFMGWNIMLCQGTDTKDIKFK